MYTDLTPTIRGRGVVSDRPFVHSYIKDDSYYQRLNAYVSRLTVDYINSLLVAKMFPETI